MRRRVPPRMISKRLRRKLRRSSNPYLLWLRLRRTRVYERLVRWWTYQFWQQVLLIDPYESPFFSSLPKVTVENTMIEWRVDL